MDTSDKDFFKRVFSMAFIIMIIMALTSSMLWIQNYVTHIPKDINHFTYKDNILSFTVPNDSNSYKLKLPQGTIISDSDKLGIVMLQEHHSQSGGNLRSVSYNYVRQKEINFFINDKLTYNLNNHLELTYTFTDPATGLVVEKVFN